MAHQELGAELLKRVEADLADYAIVEQFPRMEGRQMVMVLQPRKEKAKSGTKKSVTEDSSAESEINEDMEQGD